MAYATQQDLVDRYGSAELMQLTDRTNRPVAAIDVAVVGGALADASALIDGYLAKVYELPLASVPPILTRMCADIARAYLWGSAADPDGAVAKARQDAIAWLRDVSRGLVQLEVGGTTSPEMGSGNVRFTGNTAVFSHSSLKGL